MTSEQMMEAIKDLPSSRKIENTMRVRYRYGFGPIATLKAFVRSRLPWPPEKPLWRAQILADAGFEAETDEAVELARRAIDICQDCADAFVLLAERSATRLDQVRIYYQAGVEAGERALGKDVFENSEGDFWALLMTRPYMRARAGLAVVLMRMGEIDAAMQHLEDLLRLNPNDNRGNRFLLIDCYLSAHRQEALAALVEKYDDDASSKWAYTKALLCFRVEGASDRADHALVEALHANPHVPDLLLGKKRIGPSPAYVRFGDESEAIEYAATGRGHWRNTYGALRWLRSRTRGAARRPSSPVSERKKGKYQIHVLRRDEREHV